MSKKQKGKGKSKGRRIRIATPEPESSETEEDVHVAYSAVTHTTCPQMKVGSSALRVDDGHMMTLQVLTMMMTIWL